MPKHYGNLFCSLSDSDVIWQRPVRVRIYQLLILFFQVIQTKQQKTTTILPYKYEKFIAKLAYTSV